MRTETADRAKWGFWIGALGGGLIGAAGSPGHRLSVASWAAVSWGLLGAVIGALNGHLTHYDTLVYRMSGGGPES